MTAHCLALNVGSSSLKFALAPVSNLDAPRLEGVVDRIGSAEATLKLSGGQAATPLPPGTGDHGTALDAVANAIAGLGADERVVAIGHRIVHGGTEFAASVVVDGTILDRLRSLVALAPLHQPAGIAGIEAAQRRFPGTVQVAAFDTAFHRGKPFVNDAYALPRTHYDTGIRRYGFHGLSCQSVMRGLRAENHPLCHGKLVIAHLGNGCSVTAVDAGKPQASSMGFSTLDGLVMGTRTGAIDPGVLLHLLRDGMGTDALEDLLYRGSGLLGLSGLSNDMRDLLASSSEHAQEAVDYFVARAVQEICRLAGAMGGLDGVVFCGGIGENAGSLRDRVTAGLSFLQRRDGAGVKTIVRQTREENELLIAARDAAIGPAQTKMN